MANPYMIHVGDLLKRPGQVRPHRMSVLVDWGVDLITIDPDTDVVVDLELSGVSGGVMMRGTLECATIETCVRCLTDNRVVRTIPLTHLVEAPGSSGDDGYELVGDLLDLEPILRDEILLSVPLRPVCESQCGQLETSGETDLNMPTPGEADRVESPFAVLQNLFEQGERST